MKGCLNLYSQILESENNDKIDVVRVCPFGVTTSLMDNATGPFYITPQQCAITSIAATLAGRKHTYTHAKHYMLPLFMFKKEEKLF